MIVAKLFGSGGKSGDGIRVVIDLDLWENYTYFHFSSPPGLPMLDHITWDPNSSWFFHRVLPDCTLFSTLVRCLPLKHFSACRNFQCGSTRPL
jgi:hypothetical protein